MGRLSLAGLVCLDTSSCVIVYTYKGKTVNSGQVILGAERLEAGSVGVVLRYSKMIEQYLTNTPSATPSQYVLKHFIRIQ